MKKLMLALFLLFGGIAFVNAQDTTQNQMQNYPQDQDQNRQKIQTSDLPQAVRSALESQDYQGWNVSSAYRSTQTDASDETKSMEVYTIELKNGAQTKTVKFDRDGNKIGNDDQGQGDQGQGDQGQGDQ